MRMAVIFRESFWIERLTFFAFRWGWRRWNLQGWMCGRSRHIGARPAQRNRAIAGFQSDLGPTTASVLSFQVRITGLGRSFLQGIRGEFRVNVAGMAIGKNLEA